jgi:hypothetical protein
MRVRVLEDGSTFYAQRRTPFLIMLLASLGGTIAVPLDANAATISTRYSLSYMGLTVGAVVAVNRLTLSAFESELEVRLTGAASVITPYKMSMKASGSIRQGMIQPSSFSSRLEGGGESRTMRVSLARGIAKSSEIYPPFEDIDQRVPVTEEHKRKVFDPLSALIMTIPSGGGSLGASACNRTLHVFDGFSRSDIELTYVRSEPFKTKGYAGPVSVCSARYVPIAGHNPNSNMTRSMAANRGIEVRLAPIQDTPLIMIVSATVPMPLGTGVVELDEFQIKPTVVGSNE